MNSSQKSLILAILGLLVPLVYGAQSGTNSRLFNTTVVSQKPEGPAVDEATEKAIDDLLEKITFKKNIADYAHEGDWQKVIELANKTGTDLNAKDSDSADTALMYAVRYEKLEIMELLIKAGADVNAKDNDGYAPLHRALFFGKLKAIHLLIKLGVDVNAKVARDRTPLMVHILYNEKNLREIVQILIQAGADINVKDKDGNTALMWAAWRGYLVIVKELVKAGAYVNAKNKHGETALFQALKCGNADVVKYLQSLQKPAHATPIKAKL